MTAEPAPPRPLIFVWENIGPTHADRLAALAARMGAGQPITAVQFADRSDSYGWDPAAGAAGVRVLTLADGHGRGWRLFPALLGACWRAGRGADIFLCHYERPAVALCAAVLRLGGRRVHAMIDSKFDDYPRRLRHDLVKALVLLPYRGALAGSGRTRDYLAYLGVPRARIATGYDCLSVDRIAALSGVEPAPDGPAFATRDWVVVARLVPKKNLPVAVRAFAHWLRGTRRPRRLHLLGSGPMEGELRALAASLGVADRVVFHGFVQTDAVSRQLGTALALILPSTEEQFGLAVIEAQAVGLPVLVSRQAGAADDLVRTGVNGFAIDPRDPEALAALMLHLSEDDGVWRRFATAARDGRYRGDARHFVDAVAAITGRVPPQALPVPAGAGTPVA